MHDRNHWNACRYRPGDSGGHYESYFQRANHPSRPLAFWIRYTIFSPKNRPDDAIGELWAIYFDGENDRITAVKDELPMKDCSFARNQLNARVGTSVLDQDRLVGAASNAGDRIAWDLSYTSPHPVLLFLSESMYSQPLPKAKALVGSPLAVYTGSITVDGRDVAIDGWTGSQNHNWGSKHTDMYAWGQVAGFDGAPDAFLECGTGRIKLGPLWSPWMTLVGLRLDGESYHLGSWGQALRARGRYSLFDWTFHSKSKEVEISGRITAPASAFVGLPYYNPPGGVKTCLNSKIARCELEVRRPDRPPLTLRTENRAAFEILTDATDHGVRVVTISDPAR